MDISKLHFQPLGEQAILISWQDKIEKDLLIELLKCKEIINKKLVKLNVEVINTYNSLLVNYNSTIRNVYNEISLLKEVLLEAKLKKKIKVNKYLLPVCYEDQFGLDLADICDQKNIGYEEFISLHSSPVYTLFFIGFLPGFLYLGGLPKELEISRKNTPRLNLQKGAVGIGEKQTGIYPQNSAGGWQIVGNCPVSLFERLCDPPSPFLPGDEIKFEAISIEEHQDILRQVQLGEYKLNKLVQWE